MGIKRDYGNDLTNETRYLLIFSLLKMDGMLTMTNSKTHKLTRSKDVMKSHNKGMMFARKGLSFVEVGVVTAIIILIAAIGIPAINDFVTENRAPKVAEELQRFIARTKAASESASTTPYTGLETSNLARALKSSSVVKVVSNNEIEHRLGGGTTGLMTLSDAEGGRAFAITLTNVNEIVCPTLATIMQSTADSITIGGTPVKTTNYQTSEVTLPYNAAQAQNSCVDGDNNAFVFTTR